MDLRKTIPRVATGVFIFNEDKLLLFKSHKWSDKYCVPGGHLELGETTKECAVREVKEETGLDITDLKLLKVDECIYPKEFHEKRHFIFFTYFAKTNETKVILNEEATHYEWVPLKDALTYDLNKPSIPIIKHIIKENLIN